MAAGRPRLPGVARHIHIDPYVRVQGKTGEEFALSVNGDPRIDKALRWLDSHPKGKVTAMCWELIVAAVNGELGIASVPAIMDDDTERTQKALQDMLNNMVFEDDD